MLVAMLRVMGREPDPGIVEKLGREKAETFPLLWRGSARKEEAPRQAQVVSRDQGRPARLRLDTSVTPQEIALC